ncbi:MAG: heme o synthase [Alphaproteobacteria bacterium]|nr:heme o synthase [Alphaproteobacteria bacterium]
MSNRLSVILFDDVLESPPVTDYVDLLKPRVMSLVVFTSLCGLLVSPGIIHPIMAFIAILCIAVGAGAAGCLNMWYEADIDSKMERTKNRPIPRGVIDRDTALAFGIILALGSVILMAISINYISAGLLAFTILFYLVIYTMILKPRTPQNIVIGGLAGALPPLIGWTAVTGTINLPPLIMVAIIFFWTIPHFWALALVKSGDYGRADIPMMPNVRGVRHTKKQIVVYAIMTVLSPLFLCWIGFSGLILGAASIILGAIFFILSIDLLRRDEGGEMRLFAYSIIYLFLLFLSIVVDQKVPLS